MKRYFEENYLLKEIMPKKNTDFILRVFDHLNYLEDNDINTWKNTETSNYYFEKRPIGGERPNSLESLNISSAELDSNFSKYNIVRDLDREFIIDQSMEDYRHIIHDSISYSNTSFGLFYSAESNIVNKIWLDNDEHFSEEVDRQKIIELLSFLGESYDLILVDWYEKAIVDLAEKGHLGSCFVHLKS